MKERKLQFDRKKHLMFSKKVKKILQEQLLQDYPEGTAEALWGRLEYIYEDFLKDQPYIGGKKNSQAQAVYDCIALFAYYEADDRKPDVKKLEDLCNDLFVPKTQSPVKMTWPVSQRVAHMIFSHIANKAKKHEKDWPGNYHMKVKPYVKGMGSQYIFSTCPIADFAKRHGYEDLMPAMCNPDYPTLLKMDADLIRRMTCGNGPCCDFWVVPIDSPYLARYSLKEKDGFLYNEPLDPGEDEQYFG